MAFTKRCPHLWHSCGCETVVGFTAMVLVVLSGCQVAVTVLHVH